MKLMDRKIKNFNENNWWHWGRGLYEGNSDRIYVNCKTRDNKPFLLNENKYYDGIGIAFFQNPVLIYNQQLISLTKLIGMN
jgi:adenine-specific DNA-methyltransferase